MSEKFTLESLELDLVDQDIRTLFVSLPITQSYIIGTPMLFQLLRELRKINHKLDKINTNPTGTL